ncbi:hypothetical protein KR067_011723, partial [Drosophila pandora]
STPAAGDSPKPESAGGDKPVTPANPGSGDGSPATSSGSKCKPSEIFTQSGCVDRESFLDRVVVRSWKDEGFDREKYNSGMMHSGKCMAGQVMTPHGCRSILDSPHAEEARAPVHHSNLMGSKVIYSGIGAQVGEEKSENHKKVKPARESGGPRILGENRPRYYVFLPGRALRHKKRCRSYEVRGMENRCIRRRKPSTRRKHHETQKENHH